jgi:hypothetical protein
MRAIAIGLGTILCACGAAAPGSGQAQASLSLAPPRSSAGGANAGPSNVLVVNGSSQPVPVSAVGTASVTVANAPLVGQSGTWSVGISGTPDVNASIASVQSGVNLPVTVSNTSLTVTGSVAITGTPTVNSVGPGTLASYPQLFRDADFESAPIGALAVTKIFDVSRFKRVRVFIGIPHGSNGWIAASPDATIPFLGGWRLDTFNSTDVSGTTLITRTYDAPGYSLQGYAAIENSPSGTGFGDFDFTVVGLTN